MDKKTTAELLKKSKKIILTLENWIYSKTYGGYYPKLRLYFMDDNGEFRRFVTNEKDTPAYYKKEFFNVNCWGSNRAYDLIEGLLFWAEIKDEEERQKIHNKTILL